MEFRESTKTEVKQGKLVEFKSPAKGYFRETFKSENINPVSRTPKVTLGIIQFKVKCLSNSFQWLVKKRICTISISDFNLTHMLECV